MPKKKTSTERQENVNATPDDNMMKTMTTYIDQKLKAQNDKYEHDIEQLKALNDKYSSDIATMQEYFKEHHSIASHIPEFSRKIGQLQQIYDSQASTLRYTIPKKFDQMTLDIDKKIQTVTDRVFLYQSGIDDQLLKTTEGIENNITTQVKTETETALNKLIAAETAKKPGFFKKIWNSKDVKYRALANDVKVLQEQIAVMKEDYTVGVNEMKSGKTQSNDGDEEISDTHNGRLPGGEFGVDDDLDGDIPPLTRPDLVRIVQEGIMGKSTPRPSSPFPDAASDSESSPGYSSPSQNDAPYSESSMPQEIQKYYVRRGILPKPFAEQIKNRYII